jgi:hypothetical protein
MLSRAYGHTVTVSGTGVLDGGTLSLDGPAPPNVINAATAFILIPGPP